MKALAIPAAVALLVFAASAKADELAAIVEEASVDAPVKAFSYLSRGRVIDLGAQAEVVLGYLHSCVQERVRGGVVTIGRERSLIRGGQRSAIKLDCGVPAELSRPEAEQGAVLVMREPVSNARPVPFMSVSPFIAPRRPSSSAQLTRLDRSIGFDTTFETHRSRDRPAVIGLPTVMPDLDSV